MRKVLVTAFLAWGMCTAIASAVTPSAASGISPAAQNPTKLECEFSQETQDETVVMGVSVEEDACAKNENFIAPENWDADGRILGCADHKTLISAGDKVYISVGADRVKSGTRCGVYRRQGKITDPDTRAFVGYEMARVGTLMVTGDVSETAATAEVILSSDALQVGDEVKVETAAAQ